jgi:serine/threonine-protein kinase
MSDERTFVLTSTDASAATRDELPVGMPVGNYVVTGIIAAGGCGTVYRAKHAILGRPVAIKVLHKDFVGGHPMARRFLLEAMAVNMIRHPSIVDIFDVGDLPDGRPYYVMEFLEGMDLDTHLKRHGRMSLAEAMTVFEPVCNALEAAHRAGFVHRDIKASNIHIGRDGAGKVAIKLLDFGVAKALQPEMMGGGLTQAGSRIGTSSTMAPEQIVGTDITPQTDVYALGVLLFRLLVGRNPFVAADPRELDQMHLKAAPPRASELAPVPPAIDHVVATAMAKSPLKRYASAAAMLQEVRAALPAAGPAAAASAASAGKPAVGLYVEARPSAEAADPDGAVERALGAMDPVEAMLTDAGFSIALRAGTSFLGVLALEGSAADGAISQATSTGEQILGAVRATLGDATDVDLIVAVHVAEITPGDGGTLDESSTGPLMAVADWVPASSDGAVHRTDAAEARAA